MSVGQASPAGIGIGSFKKLDQPGASIGSFFNFETSLILVYRALQGRYWYEAGYYLRYPLSMYYTRLVLRQVPTLTMLVHVWG
jgi:hypothetical protein